LIHVFVKQVLDFFVHHVTHGSWVFNEYLHVNTDIYWCFVQSTSSRLLMRCDLA
jgi:hypothetical protein